MSSIPAGSTIVSAALQLTESGCLTGASCASSAIDVYEADSDVAAAATGPQLAAAAIPAPFTATAPATQGTWDITGDDPDDGLVIQAPAAGTAGISYDSPTANVGASSLPQVTIGYIPPAVPSAPAGLTVAPGDGGALASWSAPAWNYADDTGTAAASFAVQALTSTGTVAASQTTTGDTAVITGLADGTAYTFTVTAANPVGTGPAATSAAVTPTAVPGGPAQYVSAVSQYLNGQDALNSGQAATASAALAGDSMAPADLAGLSNEDLALSPTAAALAANGEQMTGDATAVSNTLAMLSAGGSAVTVYAEADESWTTIDTSTGTSVSVPGSASNDLLFTFASPGSSPQLAGYLDADTALTQASPDSNQTAFSSVLDGPAIAAADAGAPPPLATDAFGQFTGGVDSPPPYNCNGGACPAHAATWAIAHDCGSSTQKNVNYCDNGYHDDCTDFVSRALHWGGGFREISSGNRLLDAKDLDQWYRYVYAFGVKTGWTWANAHDLAVFENRYGAYWYKFEKTQQKISGISAGALIFASHGAGNFGEIYHTGIVTKVTGRNLYITQHTFNYVNRPLWAPAGHPSWFNDRYKHGYIVSAVWVANPLIVTFADHNPDCDNLSCP